MLNPDLRSIRERLGKTQEQVAYALRISQATVSRLERGRMEMSMSMLRAYADALGVPLHVLFGYSHPPDAELTQARLEAAHLLDGLNELGLQVALDTLRSFAKVGFTK